MAATTETRLQSGATVTDVGQQMHSSIADLFPLHRAQTGDGVRATLRYLQKFMPLEICEVPTGTEVFDWRIPQEWRIRDAYIADASGQRIVDYRSSNLQVISNSQPVRSQLSLEQLVPHLVSLPEDLPSDWIPYRTAFFREAWGFCVSQDQLKRLRQSPGELFDVVIDSEFFDGSLSYGQVRLQGRSDETILVYAHCCHPSLANDNLSGMVVAAQLAKQLVRRIENGDLPARSYQFVFAPATIGAITWLDRNQSSLDQICGGLILSLVGDAGPFTYKQSRDPDAKINQAAELALADHASEFEIREFTPLGYDERQFCSPGINLPIGCLMRTPNGEFREYHTSGDNLSFVAPAALEQSLQVAAAILKTLEQNLTPINTLPCCEPQLGERGLYRAFGEHDDRGRFQEAVMWVLNLADGEHDLIQIAKRAGLPWQLVHQAARTLEQNNLLKYKT